MKTPKNRMLLALMDEYQRAAKEYLAVLKTLSLEEFQEIKDPETKDKDCRSIQTITQHVVRSGYAYANYIRALTSDDLLDYQNKIESPAKGQSELISMLLYTKSCLKDLWSKTNEELDQYSISARWNTTYDLEQMLEHAIVHILRHRRQIENFLQLKKVA